MTRDLSSLNLLANGISPHRAHELIALMESIRPPGKLRSASRSWTLCAIQGDKTELDLSNRSLGAGCAALLSYELKDHKAITCLNLSTNNLGPVGARQIAKAVETNRTFIALDLSDCNLCNIDENGEGVRDDSGVTAIVQAVKTSRFRIRILTHIGELANHIVHITQEPLHFACRQQCHFSANHARHPWHQQTGRCLLCSCG